MNREEIERYTKLVEFLGKALGERSEVVLHNVEEGNYHIVAIVNNHISKRSKDSPITQFALDLIQNKTYLETDYLTDYKVQSIDNKLIRGSTFFIKDDNQNLKGMLCINTDYTDYYRLSKDALAIIGQDWSEATTHQVIKDDQSDSFIEEQDNPGEVIEILANDVQDIVADIIDPALLNNQVSLSQEAKVDIVRQLDQRGVFQIKGAVSKVAEILNVSEPSVYRYLKLVR